jgi:hypothetical protein
MTGLDIPARSFDCAEYRFAQDKDHSPSSRHFAIVQYPSSDPATPTLA